MTQKREAEDGGKNLYPAGSGYEIEVFFCVRKWNWVIR